METYDRSVSSSLRFNHQHVGLEKGKVQLERSSSTEETPRQPKPSKKTMDRIDDTKEPAEDLDKKAVKKTATDDVKKAKKEEKRKAESEEPAAHTR
ncbi:hypothetical protein D6D27_00750 [Aureobasidium pullulans]|nr:hypothetical protein D6D27_00750 [Aureobasidium pullulans]